MYFKSLFALLAAALPTAVLAQSPAATHDGSGYHLAARWKAGDGGGCQDVALDSQARRLYLVRAGCVQVFDTENKGALVRTIPGLDEGRGVALAPEFDRGFASSSRSGTVLVFSLTSLRPDAAPIPVGRNPGAVVYEPLTRHVFVCNGGSDDASIIDPATATVIATIPLGGTPLSAVSDGRGSLFVNLAGKNEVLGVDAQKNTVTHRWPLAPGVDPAGLAVDPIRNRIFAGCRNGRMIVLDARSGRHLAELPIGKGPDACAVDPGTGLAFASCADGTLTVVQEDPATPGGLRVAESIKMQWAATTVAVDSKTHAAYVAAADPEAAPTRLETEPRGVVVLKFMR